MYLQVFFCFLFFDSSVQVLVDELDYLPDEVDDMDPQIAAVVIEKSLPRPRAGTHQSLELLIGQSTAYTSFGNPRF